MSVSITTLQSEEGTLLRLTKLQYDRRLQLEFDESYPYMQFIRDYQKKKKKENSYSLNVIASLRESFHRIYTTPQIALK